MMRTPTELLARPYDPARRIHRIRRIRREAGERVRPDTASHFLAPPLTGNQHVDTQQLAGQLALFLLMLVVGLELTLADFRRVLAAPRAVIGGTLGQILLLPAMTWAVVLATDVSPAYGAGAILVAVSPGAGMSNICAALARANVALSVTLTAIASVLAVVTLPIFSSVGMRLALGEDTVVDVPVVNLMTQLSLTLLLPISIGMWLRTRRPERAQRLAPIFHRATLVALVLAVGLGILFTDEAQISFEGSGRALLAATLWSLSAMALGWAMGSLLRLERADRVTFVIEFTARNVGVAAIVAMSGLGRLDLTFFSGIYATVAYPMVGLLALWHRRVVARQAPTEALEV
jgi:BASS family bile acid:Na+ symporter